MQTQPILMGFDCRNTESILAGGFWSDDRREQYLLRKNVGVPISVDTMVLPSLFASFNSTPDHPAGVAKVEPQVWWAKQITHLWPDNEEMEAVLRLCGVSPTESYILKLAIELLPNDEIQTHELWKGLLSAVAEWRLQGDGPREAQTGRELLGFDIADAGRLSGLMNCGYDENERSDLRSMWVDRINEHGLIADVGQAFEFQAMTNRRVPEHAPFAVFAIYRIR